MLYKPCSYFDCVNCGACEPKEVYACDSCSEEFDDEDSLIQGLCEFCRAEIVERFVNLVSEAFTLAELNVIDDVMDGGYFLSSFLDEDSSS